MFLKTFTLTVCFFAAVIINIGCHQKKSGLFSKLESSESGIHFSNDVHDTDSTNSLINEFGYLGGGVGIGDFNNDGLPDVMTLDMLPEDNKRQKLLRGPDEYDKYNLLVDSGYFHQNMRNTLQLNQGMTADSIPVFSAVDANGNVFSSETVVGVKPVIIYFYPKDDTPGCTVEACTFRDQYQDFKELGAEVIGISSDSDQSHGRFVKKYNLPFLLLSDPDKKIRKMFGVPNDFLGLIPGRATYVVDKNGIIQFVFDSTSAKNHIKKALDFLKRM
jgi:peroxiredoxin Q/BCP